MCVIIMFEAVIVFTCILCTYKAVSDCENLSHIIVKIVFVLSQNHEKGRGMWQGVTQ